MTGPRRYLSIMFLSLVLVAAITVMISATVSDAFFANPFLNGFILAVLVLGIIYIFRQVWVLKGEINWIERFRTGQPSLSSHTTPRYLAPMASMMGDSQGKLSLSALAMRSVLDGIAARLDESRQNSRYLIGLLIFLGLLGTFFGLLQTISSVGGVIGGLSVGTGDIAAVFGDLKAGLEAPIAGMGTAFSSSLFGLAGSLVLGFLDLQAGQAQNRFYNDLEDWLSGQTRLSSGTLIAEGDQSIPAYVQALLEQTAVGLENLQRTLERSEESRISANTNIATLTEKLSTLSDHMRTEQNLMMKLAENQLELKPILAQLAETSSQGGMGLDDSVRTHIRNLDVYMARLLEELATGRAEMIQEIRSEIRVLARTLAAVAEKAGR